MWIKPCAESGCFMHDIHDKCVLHGKTDGFVNYVRGANIAGFIKVADAMLAYGIV